MNSPIIYVCVEEVNIFKQLLDETEKIAKILLIHHSNYKLFNITSNISRVYQIFNNNENGYIIIANTDGTRIFQEYSFSQSEKALESKTFSSFKEMCDSICQIQKLY